MYLKKKKLGETQLEAKNFSPFNFKTKFLITAHNIIVIIIINAI